jgi:PASTA domain
MCILLGVIVTGSASAPAEVIAHPTYAGAMTFGEIDGPSDPEEYSWEVSLGEGQELELVDDQHAQVYYTEGHHPVFGITATAAHDAVGSDVPTSLSVSEGNVITLTVHHRAGNPASGGAPFVYPVIAGEGWEGGLQAHIVPMPKDEQELREERERMAREEREAMEAADEGARTGCLVPKLKRRTLRGSKRRLHKAGCNLGRVRMLKGATGKAGRVVKQNPRPGVLLAPGTTVRVTLAK